MRNSPQLNDCRKPYAMARIFTVILAMIAMLGSQSILADATFAKHRVVIQSSSSDPELQGLVVTIAGNLEKYYGMDNVQIEVVGYGPGFGILTKGNPNEKKVKSLLAQDVKFSACEGTMKFIASQNHGKMPKLIPGVGKVKDGAVRVIELQENGYSYLYPR